MGAVMTGELNDVEESWESQRGMLEMFALKT